MNEHLELSAGNSSKFWKISVKGNRHTVTYGRIGTKGQIGDYKMLANMLPQPDISIKDARPPKGVDLMDFIKKSDLGSFTLYSLRNDPSESTDLSGAKSEQFNAMREQMLQLHAEIRDEGPVYDLRSKKK